MKFADFRVGLTVLIPTIFVLGCTGSNLKELQGDRPYIADPDNGNVYFDELTDSSSTVLTAGQSANFSLGEAGQSNGYDREYRLVMPQNYDATKAYKLLMAFHHSGGVSSGMRDISQFHLLSDDYIVAYPQAAAEAEEWNEGCDCNKPNRLGVDDLTYVDNVIADIKINYAIDESEIYAVGYSQGGLFVQNLLCNRSDTFKAIVSVASPMSVQLSQKCEIDTPTSYMMVHGKQDSVLPFAGLDHANFGLISATDAISLLAQKNNSLVNPLIKKDRDGVEVAAFWNGKQRTQLFAITKGGHSYSFEDFNTSQEALKFFAENDLPEVPEHSQLVDVDGKKLHVRVMGDNSDKPTVVLLSGPNKNFHADSAWFAALQPTLAEDYKVVAVDRAGNGWSEYDANVSYTQFVDQLHKVLVSLGEQQVILLSFASGNITTRLYQDKYGNDDQVSVQGQLWVDPDIFLPHSIAMYQDYPVTYYRENLAALLPYLETGAWTERTFNKLVAEREEVESLIGENAIDWPFFDAAIQQRLLTDRQQTRALEIAHYHDDLNNVRDLPLMANVPVSVIDSDFEKLQIEEFPDAAETLTQWMIEGTQWSKQVASESGGQYIPLTDSHHLVTFEHPQVIVEAVNWLVQQ